ncbi:MAG: 4-(cytidine 5'-diphospho)-2-C-methyl-D-erythritol kinase [Zetaproteobacteria bacterium]|nr:4-(cytidine 5'-diphospho)-2-C-methyl-D-erythritol kinase [Zetaproteobacteria bacterium]
MMPNTLYLAPAKVNLHLAITATLANGYHTLDTSFVYVDVADTLHISPATTLQVDCSNPSLSGEKNLVFQLLDAMRQHFHVVQGLNIFIQKHLPAQAGLGGGSSDAATAMMVANRMWNLNRSREELIAFATPFGADIPCFLYQEASLALGIGDALTPYPDSIPTQTVLLAFPNVGLSTQKVFQHFDQQPNKFIRLTSHNNDARVRTHSRSLGMNDLESSACALSNEVKDLLDVLRQHSEKAWMSGSGSCCVALLNTTEDAKALQDHLYNQKLATWTHVGNFLTKHPLLENIGA